MISVSWKIGKRVMCANCILGCKSLDKSFDDRISACKANAMGALDW